MAKRTENLPKTDAGWQAWLQNRRPPKARTWLPMGSGLVACLVPSGDVVFQARLRRVGDKNARRITLGHFPECSVSEGRQRLLAARAAVREGRDPSLARRRAQQGVVEIAVFGQLADRYLADRIDSGRLRPKTLAVEAQAVEKLKRALGARLLADITPLDIATVVEKEAKRLRKADRSGRSANIMLATAKRIFRHGRGAGLYTKESPAAELKRPTTERARTRILFDGAVLCPLPGEAGDAGEIGRLAASLADDDAPGPDRSTRAALALALMLGARAGEIAALKWSAVRLDDEIPALTITSGKTAAANRVLPLPAQAVVLLRRLRAEAPKKAGGFVFPARVAAGRAEHLHAESLSRAFSRLCDRLKIEGAVLHDLRRTCLSAIVELTGDTTLAERIAGHKGGSTLARHYDRSARLAPMLAVLTQWADAIDAARARFGVSTCNFETEAAS